MYFQIRIIQFLKVSFFSREFLFFFGLILGEDKLASEENLVIKIYSTNIYPKT